MGFVVEPEVYEASFEGVSLVGQKFLFDDVLIFSDAFALTVDTH